MGLVRVLTRLRGWQCLCRWRHTGCNCTLAFGFDEAAAIAGYLHALGISHLYSSPSLQAGKGSTHGYDVLDHTR